MSVREREREREDVQIPFLDESVQEKKEKEMHNRRNEEKNGGRKHEC
jgi:hypothetical protein